MHGADRVFVGHGGDGGGLVGGGHCGDDGYVGAGDGPGDYFVGAVGVGGGVGGGGEAGDEGEGDGDAGDGGLAVVVFMLAFFFLLFPSWCLLKMASEIVGLTC